MPTRTNHLTFVGGAKIKGLPAATAEGDAVALDSGLKIPVGVLPATVLNSRWSVASQAAMLALSSAVVGDLAIRSDVSKTFVLGALPASTLGNWTELLSPLDGIQSIAGLTSATITAAELNTALAVAATSLI